MTWMAAAIGGSALLGAGASIFGSKKQEKASQQSAALMAQQAEQTRQNLYPFINVGQTAAGQLGREVSLGELNSPFTLEKFQQSPSYKWQLQQGQQAIDKGANARGNFYAPQTLQDLGKFQQGLASTDFRNAYEMYMKNQDQRFNQLQNVASLGSNAATGQGSLGLGAAQGQGGFLTSGANAQAQGYMGAANSLAGGAMGLAGYNQYMQGMNAPSYGGGFNTAPNYDTMPMGRR